MYLLGIGVLLLALKYLEIGPVALWSWWIIFAPFGLAVAWWSWADASGYTKRKAMEEEDRKRDERMERSRDALGMLSSRKNRRRR